MASRRRTAGLLGAVALLTGVLAPGAVSAVSPVSQTFVYTGSEQQFTVPADITTLHVIVIGANGGDGNGVAGGGLGKGARLEGDLAVTPGTTLYAAVGGVGGGGGRKSPVGGL